MITIILLGAVFVLLILLTLVSLESLRRDERLQTEVSLHGQCHVDTMEAVTSIASAKGRSAYLRILAERYDSIEERPNLHRISGAYRADGASIPALWLREEADRLDAEAAARIEKVHHHD